MAATGTEGGGKREANGDGEKGLITWDQGWFLIFIWSEFVSAIADRMHCCLKLCSSSKVFMDLYLFACFMHFSNLRSSQVGVSIMISESKLS